jgi:hypothetical protein
MSRPCCAARADAPEKTDHVPGKSLKEIRKERKEFRETKKAEEAAAKKVRKEASEVRPCRLTLSNPS